MGAHLNKLIKVLFHSNFVVMLTLMSACTMGKTDIGANFHPGIKTSLTSSTLVASPAIIGIAGTSTVLLSLKDENSNPFISSSTTVVFSEVGGTSTGTFSAVVDHHDGTYTSVFTGVTAGTPTTIHVSINAQDFTGILPTIQVSNNVATQVAFTTEPSTSGTAASALSQQPVVTLQDANGNTINSTENVTLTLYSDAACTTQVLTAPGGANSVAGTATVTAVSGIATFSALAITKAATSLYFKAATGSATTDCSTAINVSPGAVNSIAFTTQPSATNIAATNFGTQPAVTLYDANMNPATNVSTGTVALTVSAGSLASGASASIASGVATFAGVSMNSAGTGLTLSASYSSQTATSTSFSVSAGTVTQLVFTTPPSTSGNTDTALVTQPIISGEDAEGNVVTSYTSGITLTPYSTTDCSGSSVAGGLSATTNPVPASSGVSSFAALKILKTNVQSIQASDGTVSGCFNTLAIAPGAVNSIAFSTQPSSSDTVATNFATEPVVTLYDSNMNVATNVNSGSVALTISSGTLAGGTTAAIVNGVATFAGVKTNSSGTGLTVAASYTSLNTTSSTFTVNAGAVTQLVFNTTPSTTGNTDTALTAQPVLAAKDAQGNVVPTYSSAITLSAFSGTDCTGAVAGGLSANANPVTAASGLSTFAGLKILKTNVQSIKASDGTLSSCFNTLAISPGAVNSLAFTTQPSTPNTAATNFTTQPVVTLYDANMNIATNVSSGNVALTINAGTLAGGTSASITSGTATFAGVKTNSSGTGLTLQASYSGKNATSSAFDVSAGSATQLVISTSPSTTGNTDTALTTQPVVTAKDANNNIAPSYAGTITFTGYSDSSCNTSVPTSMGSGTPTNSAGVVTFAGVKILKTNVVAVKATDGTLTSSCLNGFTISPGAVNLLTFSTQPSGTAASGATFAQQPSVSAWDANNNALGASTAITLTVTSGAPTLSCSSNPVNTNSSGVSTFSSCNLTGVDGTYTLTATAGGITVASSNIVLGAGTASQLVFTTTPSTSGDTDTALTTQPVVSAKDAQGNVATSYASSVTLTPYASADCSGSAVASGLSATTNPVTAASGVSTFAALKILKTNVQSIKASDGSLSSCFNTFAISPGAVNSIAFTTQPSSSDAAAANFGTEPVVTLYDANLNIATNISSGNVALTISSGSLAGGTSANIASGVAAFAGVKTNSSGSGLTLGASYSGKTATSTTFSVNAGTTTQLAFTTSPSTSGNTDTALSTQPVITAKDAQGNVDATYSAAVTLSAFASTDCSGTAVAGGLSATTNPVTASSGVSTFAGVQILKTNVQSIKASDGTVSGCFNTLAIAPGAVNTIAFTTQPSTTNTAATSFSTEPVVTLYDAHSNIVTTVNTGSVAMTISSGSLTGGTSAAISGGVATFSGVQTNSSGSGFTLAASYSGKNATSNTFAVNAGTASQLVFTTAPSSTGNTDTNLATQAVVTAKDAEGNVNSTYVGNVTLNAYSSTDCSGSTVTSGITASNNPLTAASGVATYAGLKILKTNVQSIKATDGTISSSCLNGFNISPGALNSLSFNTQPSTTATNATAFTQQASVSAFDANNNALGAGTAVTLALTSGTPTLACTTNPVSTNASGIATFAGCKLTGATGTYTLTASSGGKTAISGNIALGAGAASQLIITSAPSSSGNTDSALSTQPVVTAQDANANTASAYAGTITFTGYSDSSCNTTVATSVNSGTPTNTSGVVSFTGVKITKTNVVAVKATDGTLTSSCLNGFTISPGAINTLTFSTQPSSSSNSASAFAQQPVVSAFDANNNALNSGTAVTLSLTSGTPTLACTTNPVNTDSSNLATFAGCKLTGSTGTYTLTATSGGKTVNSGNITLGAGAASQLVISTPPSSTGNTDSALSTQPVVTAKDANSNTATSYAGTITFNGYSDSSCSTLVSSSVNSGTPSNSSGVVSFTGVTVLKTNIVAVKATDGTLTSSCLNGFTISPGAINTLTFSTQPSSTATDATAFAQQPSVSAFDSNNNALGASTSITLSLTSGSPTLACTTNPVSTNSSGISTFAGCKLTGVAGTYTLTATSGGKTATSGNIVISAGAASQLVITTPPSTSGNTDTALATQPIVTAEDANNNTASTYAGTITFHFRRNLFKFGHSYQHCRSCYF